MLKGKKSTVFLIILFSLCFLVGCAKVDISIENNTPKSPVSNLVIGYNTAQTHLLGTLEDGEEKTFSFVPTGDSSVALSYTQNGKNYKIKTGYTTRGLSDSFKFIIVRDENVLLYYNKYHRWVIIKPGIVE